MSDDLARLSSALADRYAIDAKIGEGGMATVYRARDLRHDRAVAIKVLRPELAAVIGAERFLAEIRTTANLQHPHILPLHDSGEAAGSVFYVMPFVEGESLRDRLERERQLPVGDALQLVSDVAAALDYAHRHGVIHRDIKPENILLHDGRALVADFGIALAATSAGNRMTETGMSLGTPSYMSPEQAMGERTLDARTDVYALGCVLYEMLVGAPPFVGPTAQSIVAKVLTERPSPPSSARDTVSAALDDVVLTALAKLPADRQPSAAVFAEALREAGRDRGATHGRAHAAATAPQPSRRIVPMVFGIGGIVGAALTAALILGLGGAGGAPSVRAQERLQLTFDGKSTRPALSPDGRFVVYTVGGCGDGPERPCDFSIEMQEIGGAKPVVLVEHARGIGETRWTADGSRVVFGARLDDQRAGVYTIPRLGGVPSLVTTRDGSFDVHPRADSLVLLSGGWAVLMNLANGAASDSVAVPAGVGRRIAWSPDGERFAIVRTFSSLTVVGRRDGVVDSVQQAFRSDVHWGADGRSLLLLVQREGTSNDLVRVAVDANGRLARTPEVLLSKEPALPRAEFGVAREMDRLAMVRGVFTSDIWRFRLDGNGDATRVTQGTTYYGAPTFTPDGTRMYFARGDVLGDNLYVLGQDGKEQALTREPHSAGIDVFAVGPDGRRVMFSHTFPDGYRLSEMRLPAGEVAHAALRLPGLTTFLVPFGSRGYVYIAEEGASLQILDSLLAAPRALPLGDGRRAIRIAGGRRDDALLVVAVTPGATGGAQDLLRVPLDGAPPELVARIPGSLRSLHLRDDGSIWFSRWVGGDAGASLWEIPGGSGIPQRRADVPSICANGAVAIARSAPVAACLAGDVRSDVWVVDGAQR